MTSTSTGPRAGDVIDLFAGPGGWSEGLRRFLGIRDIGLEWDRSACLTRQAAGHLTIQTDVAAYPTRHMAHLIRGLIASPPCTLFSSAGKGTGRRVLDLLAAGIRRLFRGEDCRAEIRQAVYPVALAERHATNDKKAPERRLKSERVEAIAREDAFGAVLVLEPARWIAELLAVGGVLEWVCLEQVTAVLPLWQVYAEELSIRGWSTWAGTLNAADYGVPQTRRRAILIANRARPATPPESTHSQNPTQDLFSLDLTPWITMAGALGWGTERAHWVLRSRRDSPGWVASDGPRRNRTAAEPAPTFTGEAHRWYWDDPYTGHSQRVTVAEAGVLQSFPTDHPWRGPRTRTFLQAGNAVPPLLAAHVVSAATGIPLTTARPTPALTIT